MPNSTLAHHLQIPQLPDLARNGVRRGAVGNRIGYRDLVLRELELISSKGL
jgi:hypothetical protein